MDLRHDVVVKVQMWNAESSPFLVREVHFGSQGAFQCWIQRQLTCWSHFQPSGRDWGMPSVTSPLILSACGNGGQHCCILSLAVLKGIVSVNSPHECSRPQFPMGVAENLLCWLGVTKSYLSNWWTTRCALARLFWVISGSLRTILPLRACIFQR